MSRNGPVHTWFGLTYAAYLVLPRALLQGMSEAWQERFVELLQELRGTYDSERTPDNYTVQLRGDGGRFVQDEWSNYRRPPKLPYRKGARS